MAECTHCQAPSARFQCGKCHSVQYCSVECQKLDWQAHHKYACASKPSYATVTIGDTIGKRQTDIPDDAKLVRTRRLANGLTIVAYPLRNTPRVTIQLVYKVGSTYEDNETRGFSHLLEHMMFKGTKEKLSEVDVPLIARQYGAAFNAFTSNEKTAYYFEANRETWPVFMSVMADTMQNLGLERDHLQSEVRAVLQELRRGKDSVSRHIWQEAQREVYPSNHAYHYPVIGFKEDLSKARVEQLRDYYARFYRPDNAILFLVGDLDDNLERSLDEAEALFAQVPPSLEPIERPHYPRLEPRFEATETTLYKPLGYGTYVVHWRTPGFMNGFKPEAIETFTHLFANAPSSRLGARLVHETKLATQVSISANVLREAGILLLSLNGAIKMLPQARQQVYREWQRLLQQGGFNDREMKQVMREHVERQYREMFLSPRAFLDAWMDSVLMDPHESVYALFSMRERYAALNVKRDILPIVAQFMHPLLSNTIKVLPVPRFFMPALATAQRLYDKESAALLKQMGTRESDIEAPKMLFELPLAPYTPFTLVTPAASSKTLENGLTVKYGYHTDASSAQTGLVSAVLKLRDPHRKLDKSKHQFMLQLLSAVLMEESEDGSTRRQHAEIFDANGAEVNISMNKLTVHASHEQFSKAFARAFLIVAQPRMRDSVLLKWKRIIQQSLLQKRSSATARAFRTMMSRIHGESSDAFSWSFDDAIKFVDGITVNELRRAHRELMSVPRFYVLAVVGPRDVMQSEIEADVERVMNVWPTGGNRDRRQTETLTDIVRDEESDESMTTTDGNGTSSFPVWRSSSILLETPMRRVSDAAPVKSFNDKPLFVPMANDQTTFLLGRTTNNAVNRRHADFVRLQMLSFMTYASIGSRLYRLRERTGIFYAASGAFASEASEDTGIDFIRAKINPENVAPMRKMVQQMFKEIHADGFEAYEIEQAKQSLWNRYMQLNQTPMAIAERFVDLEVQALGQDYYARVKAQLLDHDDYDFSAEAFNRDIVPRYMPSDEKSWLLLLVGRQ
jgi:zinc protease